MDSHRRGPARLYGQPQSTEPRASSRSQSRPSRSASDLHKVCTQQPKPTTKPIAIARRVLPRLSSARWLRGSAVRRNRRRKEAYTTLVHVLHVQPAGGGWLGQSVGNGGPGIAETVQRTRRSARYLFCRIACFRTPVQAQGAIALANMTLASHSVEAVLAPPRRTVVYPCGLASPVFRSAPTHTWYYSVHPAGCSAAGGSAPRAARAPRAAAHGGGAPPSG